MEYIVVFVVTSLILKTLPQNFSDKRALRAGFWVVLIISLFSGLRANSVGTDTCSYPLAAFHYAMKSSSYAVFDELMTENIYMREVGYKFWAFYVMKVFGDFNVFLFVSAVVVNAGFLVFFIHMGRKYNVRVWLIWLAYCFILFSQTLNLAKQSLAIALCLFAFVSFQNARKKTALLLIFIAMTFHFTAAAFLFFFVEKKIENSLFRRVLLGSLLFIALGGKILLYNILTFVPYVLQYTSRFLFYLEKGNEDIPVVVVAYHFMFILLFVIMLMFKSYRIDKENVVRMVFVMSIGCSLLLFSGLSAQAGRISFYFLPFNFAFVPYLLKNSKIYRVSKFVYVPSLFCFWLITVVIQGSAGVYPYVSILQ